MPIYTGRPTVTTSYTGRYTVTTSYTGRTPITTKSFLLINGGYLLLNGTDRLILSEIAGTEYTGRIIPS